MLLFWTWNNGIINGHGQPWNGVSCQTTYDYTHTHAFRVRWRSLCVVIIVTLLPSSPWTTIFFRTRRFDYRSRNQRRKNVNFTCGCGWLFLWPIILTISIERKIYFVNCLAWELRSEKGINSFQVEDKLFPFPLHRIFFFVVFISPHRSSRRIRCVGFRIFGFNSIHQYLEAS